MVLIFRPPASLEYLQSTGRLATQPLLGALESRGVDYLELHQPVLEVLGSRSFCELLTEPEECHGHFNAEGNGLVAAIVHRHLEEFGLGGP